MRKIEFWLNQNCKSARARWVSRLCEMNICNRQSLNFCTMPTSICFPPRISDRNIWKESCVLNATTIDIIRKFSVLTARRIDLMYSWTSEPTISKCRSVLLLVFVVWMGGCHCGGIDAAQFDQLSFGHFFKHVAYISFGRYGELWVFVGYLDQL